GDRQVDVKVDGARHRRFLLRWGVTGGRAALAAPQCSTPHQARAPARVVWCWPGDNTADGAYPSPAGKDRVFRICTAVV
ncbi:MAG TPA: hypothetical protein VGN32_21105, partial [Ktedonobacterales bacterium]|nr:hypothetical protein [Ktedonobacterales bacterium]